MLNRPGGQEPTCLLIADISGYTEYLSGVEIDHAQDILADLIGTVVTSLRPSFRLAKLEGDAAFCFAPADKIDGSLILDTIEHCYFSFRRRRRDVRQATSCECNACTRIPDLNLKFVAHHGTVLRQKVAGREELFGSDVIVVHRLLKNDIVARLGIAAYALVTDALVREMGIDPGPLGMKRHVESYEHIGPVEAWVHDLEARWQEEDARKRVYLGPADAFVQDTTKVPAPPQVVWEYLTTPGGRMRWQGNLGVTAVEQKPGRGGRRGVGTVNHCMHGPEASIEEILDWRPFDYLTDRSTMPGGAQFLSTFELEPTPDGTLVHARFGRPTKIKGREMLEQLRVGFEQALEIGGQSLAAALATEERARPAAGEEPPLPAPRKDGVLAGVGPLRIVG